MGFLKVLIKVLIDSFNSWLARRGAREVLINQ